MAAAVSPSDVMVQKEQWVDSGFNSESEDAFDEKSPLAMDPLSRRQSLPEDIESQSRALELVEKMEEESPRVETEYTVPTRTKLTYLGIYFLFNLTLTIYNKAVLGKFAFPWLLTTLHASSASIGCHVLLMKGYFRLSKLGRRENLILIAYSFLFTINIAMSNVSLAMVSVPFHQIMRSTCPLFTILLYRMLYGREYSSKTYLSMIPLILGVGMATYGDYYFTMLGFTLTLIGVILASVKTVLTNRLLTGSLKLHPLELLLRMSPLAAFQSFTYAYMTGETGYLLQTLRNPAESPNPITTFTLVALLGNGILAFFLNVSSFQTNKLAGALTIAVCGNVKQCLTIAVGILLFDVKVGLLNGVGMATALFGAAWYSKVELEKKTRNDSAGVGNGTDDNPAGAPKG